MIERRISIGNIDPIDFYGINNAKFITLKEFFPKLKITARGDEIIIQGEESDIDVLVAKINALLEHYNKYNMLTIANLKRIILEDEIVEDPEDPASIIVFGNNGKNPGYGFRRSNRSFHLFYRIRISCPRELIPFWLQSLFLFGKGQECIFRWPHNLLY